MRTLILFRHAKAASAEPGQGDAARPLTGRGRREAVEAGAALVGHGLKPDLILVSTAVRTRETAAHAFDDETDRLRYEAGLYHASQSALWEAFQNANAAVVALVAHNPGLGELAALLLEAADDRSERGRFFRDSFPTSAWAAFEIGGETLAAPAPRLLSSWRPARG